jgi:hypothetical protein
VHANGQDVSLFASIDSVSADYMKIGWSIDGLGTGAWIIKKSSLEKATNAYWDQPAPGIDTELPDDQSVLTLSKVQWASIKKDKKLLLDQQNFIVKNPSDQQLLKLKGRVLDAIMLEPDSGGERIWVLNNAWFPLIVKIEGNPKGIDLDLTSID